MTCRVLSKALVFVAVFLSSLLGRAQDAISITEYTLPQPQGNAWQLTAGPDGAIWYTVSCPYAAVCSTSVFDGIGRLTTSGNFTEYPLPGSDTGRVPYGITTGPDGALWFTEFHANKIGRITTAGVITEYPLPTSNAGPYKITAGPDGALWFTEMNVGKIGRITITGNFTEYSAGGPCCSSPTDIVVGQDGALWFTNINSGWIGRITLQGEITKYPLPIESGDYGITAGPDGALWFVGGDSTVDLIWRITTKGVFSKFEVPTKNAGLIYITLGSDGALWFTEGLAGKVGRVTTGGVFTEYSVGGTYSTGPVPITTGPDGAVWFGKWGYIERLSFSDSAPPTITVSVTPRILWPPNGQMVPVTVRGRITDLGSGLMAGSAQYALIDEYHLVQPKGLIIPDEDGNYSFTILLPAWRRGDDEDGRRYILRLSARDNAGNAGAKWQALTVPHDRR